MNLISLIPQPYRAIGAAVIVLGIAATIYTLHERLDVAIAQKDALTAGLKQVTDANHTDMATIASLQASLGVWQKTATDARVAAQQAVVDVAAQQAARTKAEAALHLKEKADIALPACNKLLAIDILQTCPAHAAVIKERAR